jgi:hypothetical protein
MAAKVLQFVTVWNLSLSLVSLQVGAATMVG